jgi:ABC-type branched-subunit amino acid transport system permease subunit
LSFQSVVIDSLLAMSVIAVLGTGRLALAGPGFMACGAIAASLAAPRVGESFWLCAFAGAAVSYLLGLLVGRGVEGLPAVSYSIATLSVTLAVPFIARAMHLMRGPAHPSGGVFAASVCLAAGILALTAAKGRQRYAAGAAAAGIACALYWSTGASLGPNAFGLDLLGVMVAVALIGGASNPVAPLLGATLLALIARTAAPLTDQPLIVDGAMLLLALVYVPQGAWAALAAAVRKISRAPDRSADGAS